MARNSASNNTKTPAVPKRAKNKENAAYIIFLEKITPRDPNNTMALMI